MTLERRNGVDPHRFSRERRDDRHGGTIPLEWGADTIDLDALVLACPCTARTLHVRTGAQLWLSYDGPKYRPRIVAVVEHKRPTEAQGFAVTQALARELGVPAYLVVDHGDHYLVTNGRGETRRYDELVAFVRDVELPLRGRQ